MRELERWVPDAGEEGATDVDLSLGGGRGGENGWKAEEMFEKNRTLYNVGSTYKANLEGYTTQLSKDNESEEYR